MFFQDIKAVPTKYGTVMKSCDAFALYFLGVGSEDGTVEMADGKRAAIYHEILPLFNSNNCSVLSGKPKLFTFHLADLGL
jgi:hypothetical protein